MELNTEVDYCLCNEDGLIYAYFYDENQDYCFSVSRFENDEEIEIMVHDQINTIVSQLDITLHSGYMEANIPKIIAGELDGNLNYKIFFELNKKQWKELDNVLSEILMKK
ncbi:MAG: hypothetical protein HON94_00970 [Methylococcales bacterium]|jgi:hypothetical protein|nr:hypothetical protein [Methylococcales bacterium]MBT7408403.1 hypothetical protein [Methylococcales bacterium]